MAAPRIPWGGGQLLLSLPVKLTWLSFTDTLLIDYQFTFSLSQEDDRYYTAINFVATPEEVRRPGFLVNTNNNKSEGMKVTFPPSPASAS